MSILQPYDLRCPACEHTFQVELATAVQITRMPEARDRILNGTFHVFTCPACGSATAVEASLLYTDLARGHYIAMESAAGLSWQAARMRHQTVFEDCFVNAPSIARELGRTIRRRVVFGLRALREKLLIWDAGLDDLVVEAVKAELLGELGATPDQAVLRLLRVLPGGHLMFARFAPGPRQAAPRSAGPQPEGGASGQPLHSTMPAALGYETAPAERYQHHLHRRADIAAELPWLVDDWLVDLHDGPAYLYR